jgi:hypothetical protein
MVSLTSYLLVGGALFGIGLFGALARRNILGVLIGIELMFNAANINFVAFNRYLAPRSTLGPRVCDLYHCFGRGGSGGGVGACSGDLSKFQYGSR